MPQACSTSPFAFQDEYDNPWILWEKKSTVTELIGQEQTDGRYEMQCTIESSDTTYRDTPAIPPVKPVIQRKQYNAVLSRMNQAVCKTGSFSTWQS